MPRDRITLSVVMFCTLIFALMGCRKDPEPSGANDACRPEEQTCLKENVYHCDQGEWTLFDDCVFWGKTCKMVSDEALCEDRDKDSDTSHEQETDTEQGTITEDTGINTDDEPTTETADTDIDGDDTHPSDNENSTDTGQDFVTDSDTDDTTGGETEATDSATEWTTESGDGTDTSEDTGTSTEVTNDTDTDTTGGSDPDTDSSSGEMETDEDIDHDTEQATDSDTTQVWILIPQGSFAMGSETGDANELPMHTVTLESFEILRGEVTVAAYGTCLSQGGCTEPDTQNSCAPEVYGNWDAPGFEDHPINCVTFAQAEAYCEWLGARLPSEAEWEFAARNQVEATLYPWGDAPPADCERVSMNNGADVDAHGCGTGRTSPVCSKPAGDTANGLCDMAGNVWEWTADDFHTTYTGAPIDGTAWIDEPRGDERIMRGACFYDVSETPDVFRSTQRVGYPATLNMPGLGIRCVR